MCWTWLSRLHATKRSMSTSEVPIRYVQGDATRPEGDGPKIIAHVCNDVGGWRRGFVVAISQRWAEPEEEYRRWYEQRSTNDFELGAVGLVAVGPDLWVATRPLRRVWPISPMRPWRLGQLFTCLESEVASPVVTGALSNRSSAGPSALLAYRVSSTISDGLSPRSRLPLRLPWYRRCERPWCSITSGPAAEGEPRHGERDPSPSEPVMPSALVVMPY